MLATHDVHLFNAISAEASQRSAEIGLQGLTNFAWSLARLEFCVAPFLCVIAHEVLQKMQLSGHRDLASCLWAFAKLA